MNAKLNKLQNLSKNNQIKMMNSHFNKIVNCFFYLFIDDADYSKMQKKIEIKTNIIIIDHCEVNYMKYIMLCFENIFILFSASDIYLLFPFLKLNQNSSFFSLSDKA